MQRQQFVLSGSTLTAHHQYDSLPEQYSEYVFSAEERAAIVAAANNVAYSHGWAYFQESALKKIGDDSLSG